MAWQPAYCSCTPPPRSKASKSCTTPIASRRAFPGAHLQETNGTARVALDLQLTALSTCDDRTKVLVDASAEDALADADDGLEVCVLWVSMTGAERRTSRCYGGGQPARASSGT